MAGIAFLYAIWHSPTVRSRLTLDDVEYTVRAATSVLADLVKKCPPAEACRDAFERMSKATIKMSVSTTGFMPTDRDYVSRSKQQNHDSVAAPSTLSVSSHTSLARPMRPATQFDMNFGELFPSVQGGISAEGPFGQWQPSVSSSTSPYPQGLPQPNFVASHSTLGTNMESPASTVAAVNDTYALPNEFDFLMMSDDTTAFDGNLGIDLGFDAGGNRWAADDGTQVDIFDGFFFGGVNTSA